MSPSLRLLVRRLPLMAAALALAVGGGLARGLEATQLQQELERHFHVHRRDAE